METIAIVRIRGVRSMKPKTKKTLELLRLFRPNHCVVYKSTPQVMGMLNVAKDYIAFGPIREETLSGLLAKRGEKGGKLLNEVLKEAEIGAAAKAVFGGKNIGEFVDPVFRLHPPRSGYKNIKLAYPDGDLGKRNDMDTLLKRMM